MEQQHDGTHLGTTPQSRGPGRSAPRQVRAAVAQGPSRIWLPELVQRFADFLTGNQVACTLRLVNKATATQFRGPQHTTVRLSLPVPHREFVRRWGDPGAALGLTLAQRQLLPRLTARSGCIENLWVLLSYNDMEDNAVESGMLAAAAGAGQLAMCRWLLLQGCNHSRDAAEKAARGGHADVCLYFLSCDQSLGDAMAAGAARGGHVGLMDRLLAHPRVIKVLARSQVGDITDNPLWCLLEGAAAGCDLPTLQRLLHLHLNGRRGDPLSDEEEAALLAAALDEKEAALLAAAAASPTPDWRGKVECLEARGWAKTHLACTAAVQQSDGRPRLEWLLQKGYPTSSAALEEAAGAGCVDALVLLLAEGVELNEDTAGSAARRAARAGHVEVLEALAAAHGFPLVTALRAVAPEAAEAGQLRVLSWLVERLGAAEVLTEQVFVSAVRSGSSQLLAWLHARGCPWGGAVFAEAAGLGSEEQLEWLAARGCPMGAKGQPYLSALKHRGLALPRLRCLQRLGCPWGRSGTVFLRALERCRLPSSAAKCRTALRVLLWLMAQGCPLDPGSAIGPTNELAVSDTARRALDNGLLERLRAMLRGSD